MTRTFTEIGAETPDTGAERIVLVEDGVVRFGIQATPSQDGDAMFPALRELIVHLRQCLDHDPPWVGQPGGEEVDVVLGLALTADPELGREGYEIVGDASQQTVTLRAASPTGLCHAVHHFLEDAFGVRWLWPGTSGAVIPRAANVTWPLGCRREQPDWAWRRLWLGGSFYQADDPTVAEMKFGNVEPETLEQLHVWQQRNRLGGLNIADGHRWSQICSPLQYGKSSPEYFALVDGQHDTQYHDGKHGNQPCTSNPEVVKLAADYIIAQFNARPELDGFSLAVNDGLGFCECDACCKIDDWARSESHNASDLDGTTADDIPFAHSGKSLTDRMLLFANQVAQRVETVHAHKLLLVLVYSVYRNPPRRVTLHPNVIAQFATATWAHVDATVHDQELQTLSGLSQFAQRRGIYDYFINGKNGSLPRGFAHLLPQCLRDYHHAGCTYFSSQASLDFATNGFAYFLAAKCLWNTKTDYHEVLDDYCRTGFGGGASHVKRYIQAFTDRWREPLDRAVRNGSAEALAVALYPPAWLAERRSDLKQAMCDAVDEDISRRVRFIEGGLEFLELFCEVSRACVEMIHAGAPLPTLDQWEGKLSAWAQTAGKQNVVDNAVKMRNHLLTWIEQHANSFCVAPMWARYQRIGRRGLLGDWLDVAAAARRESLGS